MRLHLATVAAISAFALLVTGCGSDDAAEAEAGRSSEQAESGDASGTIRGGNQTMFGEFEYDLGAQQKIVSNVVKLVVPNEGGPVEGDGTILIRARGTDPRFEEECTFDYLQRIEISITGSWPGRNWQEAAEGDAPGDATDIDGVIDEILDGGDGPTVDDVVAKLDLRALMTIENDSSGAQCRPRVVVPDSTTSARAAINITEDSIYAIGTIEPSRPSPFVRIPRFTAKG